MIRKMIVPFCIIIMIFSSFFLYAKQLENDYVEKQLALISKIDNYSIVLEEYTNQDIEKGKLILENSGYENLAMQTLSQPFQLQILPILLLLGSFITIIIVIFFIIQRKQKRDILYNMECLINRHYEIKDSQDSLSIKLNELEKMCCRLENECHQNKQRTKVFIEDIAHQIKTPLTSLKLYVELSTDEKIRSEGQRQVERIETMVTQLIHLAKLEAHSVKFNFEINDLNDIINDAISQTHPLFQKKKIIMSCDRENLLFSFDEFWLGEALVNLFNNAFEYASEVIEVNVTSFENWVVLKISDDGIGLSQEEAKYLFDRFYSSKNKTRKGSTSMGIGLNIAKEVVLSHHGHLYALPRNEGCVFILELPLSLGKEKL